MGFCNISVIEKKIKFNNIELKNCKDASVSGFLRKLVGKEITRNYLYRQLLIRNLK